MSNSHSSNNEVQPSNDAQHSNGSSEIDTNKNMPSTTTNVPTTPVLNSHNSISKNSLPIASSGSSLVISNSSEYPPFIITLPINSQPQSSPSNQIPLLARSITPIGNRLLTSPVPLVRTPCGSGWKLNDTSRHSSKSKGKAEESNESDQITSYFIDQDTGKRYKKDGPLGEFKREINMLGAAGKHANLVKYFGLVNDPSGKFPLFELCRPMDLFGLLCSRGRLTYPEVRYFGLGIAAGLAHLHDKGIIHRDLKPENVFISFDMQVRVGDLGLAARYDSRGMSKGRAGTKYFMAPEVVKGESHTYAMDIFSFGCIVYMMLLGSQPHITTLDQSFPNCLENVLFENGASSDPEKVLIPDAQDVLRTLLSFHPRARPKAKRIALQTFFRMGHCPTKLDEEVFYTPYKPVNENKRKEAPAQDEEETRVVQKVKYEYDCN
ncbi:kinase-like protein [Linnemannia elongata AG-77]|uniref:Kinase-like protein n=1 Tax=Linnemannia elongata AG-77 TaxID=1314771 RepID=A0A197KBD2_9FUNG|nr:kinase-like protein [Linnemannia elongata AG-77]